MGAALKNGVHRFVHLNRSLSAKLTERFPHTRVDVQRLYEQRVAELINSRPGLTVVDVGGGKQCHFARYRRPELGTRIVAVDVDPAEMADNLDVDEKRVADAKSLPFADGEVDMLVSRSVLEHVKDVGAFVHEASRVVKPGGYTVHVFPSRFAPFSIANQLLPRRVSRRLLHTFMPGSEGILGFPAYYDHCYYGGMTSLLAEAGFEVVEARVSYSESDYFAFLLPLYLVDLLWDALVHRLGARNLAATVLVVGRKPE
jgi:ubiquinone/menaquinone biosynthesis C-methylase UbiE